VKYYWLFLIGSVVLGTTFAWTMNYAEYGYRDAYFGEITMDGSVNAENVMEKLAEYEVKSAAVAELVGEPVYDFGALPPGSRGEHEFTIRNTGDDTLTLEVGASTCKCTLGSLEKDKLAPGESTKIKLEWKVSSDEQTFNQSAEIRTSDPLRPAIKLEVNGLVIRDIEFEPSKITFGEIAAGESFEFSTKMYSYFNNDIEPRQVTFGSEELTKLSDVEIEPFQPSDSDGVHSQAQQGFAIKVSVKEGLRQGPLVTNMRVAFDKLDENGKPIVDENREDAENAADAENTADAEDAGNGEDPQAGGFVSFAECAGRIVGSLGMIESSKLKSTESGGYIWNLGRLGPDDSLEYKALLTLKGSEKDNTTLTIGETYPDNVVQAELGEPLGKGTMKLFPIKLKLNPQEELLDLLGKNKDDFAWLWVESDNPKVSRMRVAIKVAIEPRP
jgi:hypothetical protein